MTNNIKLTESGTRIIIESPFSREFIDDIKNIGGKWDMATKKWSVKKTDEARLHEILSDCYGWTPSGMELVSVRITLDYENAREKLLMIGNRKIAERVHRDQEVKLYPDVVIEKGEFYLRGGSMRRPAIIDDGNIVVIRVDDLPLGLISRIEGKYEIITENTRLIDELKAKKAQLEAEVYDITIQIEKLEKDSKE